MVTSCWLRRILKANGCLGPKPGTTSQPWRAMAFTCVRRSVRSLWKYRVLPFRRHQRSFQPWFTSTFRWPEGEDQQCDLPAAQCWGNPRCGAWVYTPGTKCLGNPCTLIGKRLSGSRVIYFLQVFDLQHPLLFLNFSFLSVKWALLITFIYSCTAIEPYLSLAIRAGSTI